ncbi:anti-sigma B factor RsbW [Aeribacillus alveayuensis]|jgi:serine/threonine-protein kinase RsbW|uniref:Serine-protein kinase RsbW n=1 Tax=Aeribacillus alveayuensis TaxID=279215 RepID=A0ABT9VR92_9BACI|nr:serine/threonine-protein kinase RsbW [Bacillus alveayuensis]
MTKLKDYVEIKIPAKPEFIGVVRLTLSGIASRMGFSYDDIEDLKIAASEALTNAVKHAYQQDGHGEIIIGFGIWDDRLEVMVTDNGKSFDFQKLKEKLGPYSPSVSIDDLHEGGLGLFLIETLMDEVKVQVHSGVTVLMTKVLTGEKMEHDTNVSRTKTN